MPFQSQFGPRPINPFQSQFAPSVPIQAASQFGPRRNSTGPMPMDAALAERLRRQQLFERQQQLRMQMLGQLFLGQ